MNQNNQRGINDHPDSHTDEGEQVPSGSYLLEWKSLESHCFKKREESEHRYMDRKTEALHLILKFVNIIQRKYGLSVKYMSSDSSDTG